MSADDSPTVAPAAATIEQVVDIAAPPELVYELWTTAEGLARWWGRAVLLDATPGGAIHVDLGPPVMIGEFVTLDPPHRLVFRFGWNMPTPDGDLPPSSTIVDVRIEPTPTGSRVILRHHGLPGVHRAGHALGWRIFLGRMAAATPGASNAC